jgi:peptide/nickel transport system permease protein
MATKTNRGGGNLGSSAGEQAADQMRLGDTALSVARQPRSLWTDAWRQFRKHRLGLAGLIALAIVVTAVIVGPFVIPYDPNRIEMSIRDQPPSLSHPMGTDSLGRDQLVRVLAGGRVSLSVGAAVVMIAVTLGVAIGAISGYSGGVIDNVLMRIVDTVISLPGLFVLILVVALVGASFWTIVLALGFLNWTFTARLVRGEFLSLKEREFVEAARVVGATSTRIIVLHLLRNAMSPVIVAATLGVAQAILTESALSFLGLGFQPPNATWGRMLQEAQGPVIHEGMWWRGFFPGAMIFITVLSVNYLGDALRDALDVTRHQR